LVLERQHGQGTARVWGAVSADRLLAAQWLTDHKRYAEADSLLYFTRGFTFGLQGEAGEAIFAPAQLIRSRIAEGMGNNAAAVRFAQIFLDSFDKAPASQKPLVDEAKNRIARLSLGDKPRPAR
jgi:hypothetical protein